MLHLISGSYKIEAVASTIINRVFLVKMVLEWLTCIITVVSEIKSGGSVVFFYQI